MKDSIRKYSGILCLLTLFILPIGTLKPNRVLNGSDFYAWDIVSIEYFFIAFLLLFTIFSHKLTKIKLLQYIYNVILILFPIYLVYLVQTFRLPGDYDESTMRISLHASLYLSIIGVYLLISTQTYPKLKLFLSLGGIIGVFILGYYPMLGMSKEFINRIDTFSVALIRHLTLSFSSLLFAIPISLYLGYQSTKHPKLHQWIMGIINGFQVAPTLSLIALIMIPLSNLSQNYPWLRLLGFSGIGFLPSFIVLSLYALLPITSNTYTAIKQIDSSIMDSAKALGLSQTQILYKISFPLAFPLILSGIRTALTQTIGNTLLAGLVGGGGLGSIIFLGLSQSAVDLILLGSIPVIFMALSADVLLESIETNIGKRMGYHYD